MLPVEPWVKHLKLNFVYNVVNDKVRFYERITHLIIIYFLLFLLLITFCMICVINNSTLQIIFCVSNF